MKRKYFKVIKSILTILITVWILFSLMVYFNQNNLVYVPTKGSNYTPSNYNLIYEDITLTTEDNEEIKSWFIPHNNPRATLLFLHGNGGNLSSRLDSINIFHQLGLSVFIIDYRGYGDSSGTVSYTHLTLPTIYSV